MAEGRMLHLVRHGMPILDPSRHAFEWELDPARFDDVWALRESGRLPQAARWFCSPEPKAIQTAQLLTDGEVAIVEGLREHVRRAGWIDDLPAALTRAVAEPSVPAVDGWETIEGCRQRVVRAVRGLLEEHPDDDLVLVGHGTAWTLLRAVFIGSPPDLAAWRRLGFPDVIEVPI